MHAVLGVWKRPLGSQTENKAFKTVTQTGELQKT